MKTSALLAALALSSTALAKSYILVFEQGSVTPNYYIQAAKTKVLSMGGTIGHEYSTVLTGFSFSIPDTVSVHSLDSVNDARYPFFLEVDKEVYANGSQ